MATMVQRPKQMGIMVIESLYDLNTGGSAESVDTGITVVTVDNIDTYKGGKQETRVASRRHRSKASVRSWCWLARHRNGAFGRTSARHRNGAFGRTSARHRNGAFGGTSARHRNGACGRMSACEENVTVLRPSSAY